MKLVLARVGAFAPKPVRSKPVRRPLSAPLPRPPPDAKNAPAAFRWSARVIEVRVAAAPIAWCQQSRTKFSALAVLHGGNTPGGKFNGKRHRRPAAC